MKFGATAREIGPVEHMLNSARLAEEVGFDAVWVSEHHVQPDVGVQYWPATLLRLGSIATVVQDVELVTSALVLPFHHPLEVAEQAAVLDNLSGGNLTLGLGLGYVEEEFDAFNIPMEDRTGRFVEGIRILDRYLSAEDSFSFEGKIWQIDDWTPHPSSVRKPRPPLLVGGWGDLALQRAVKLGDGWIAGLTADFDGLAERQAKLERLVEADGGDWDDYQTPVMRETVIAETREEALELGKRYLHPVYDQTYGSDDWSHPILERRLVREFETLARERFLVGTPEEIVEQVALMEEKSGVDQVGCRFHFPGMPQELVEDQIRLFGEEVIPAFE